MPDPHRFHHPPFSTSGNQSLTIIISDHIYEGKINSAPTAGIKLNTQSPKVGTNLFFESDSTDSDGNVVSWYWEFGDNQTSTQRNPSHKYTKADTYVVTLTVMDDYGGRDTATYTVAVESSGGGGTPGFGLIVVCVALVMIVLGKRFR